MKRRRSERPGARGLASRVLLASAMLVAAMRRGDAQPSNAGAGPFLLAPIGARLTALGNAGAADPDPADALFTNPAAYAHLVKGVASLEYGQDELTRRYAASVGYGFGLIGSVVLGVYQQDLGSQPRVTSAQEEIGTIYFRNRAYYAGYATRFGLFRAGVVAKLIQFRIDCTGDCAPRPDEGDAQPGVASTTAFDAGVQFDLPKKSPLHLAVVLRHAGFALQVKDAEQADALPTQLVGGAACEVPRFDKYVPDATLKIVADATTGVGGATVDRTLQLGVEGTYQKSYSARVGYAVRNGDYGGLTAGVGVARKRFALDLSRQVTSGQALSNNPPTYLGVRYAF